MKRFLSNTRGVAAVEFALTVGLFLLVFFMNFELSRLALTSGYLDLGITQSVRAARNSQSTDGNYEKVFRENLEKYLAAPEETVMRMFLYTSDSNLSVRDKNILDVQYVDCGSSDSNCITQLLNGKFKESIKDSEGKDIDPTGSNVVLAVYNLKFYDFKFDTSLPFLPTSWINNTLHRKFIMVQEYERSAFK